MKRYVRSSREASVLWTDLSSAEQMAVEYAGEYLDQGYDLWDSVDRACRDISEGNIEPEYEDEEFYGEEPDFDRVYDYMKLKSVRY